MNPTVIIDRMAERAEDPVELTAERIEHDGAAGARSAVTLRKLQAEGNGHHALQLAAYIDKLEKEVDTAGGLWAQEVAG